MRSQDNRGVTLAASPRHGARRGAVAACRISSRDLHGGQRDRPPLRHDQKRICDERSVMRQYGTTS